MSDKKTTTTNSTEADNIWEEIKDKKLSMFALPDKTVSDYCQPVQLDPSRCFLLHKASSVLPALEETLGKDFECTAMEKFIVVSRNLKNVL